MPSQWTTPDPAPPDLLTELAAIPPHIVQALYRRGLSNAAAARQFLSPEDPAAGDPFALPQMGTAVDRVQRAVAAGEPIAVYADFDVDGVTSAVLLMEVLERLGAQPQVYIPHRVDEGYGLNRAAVTRLAESGIKLMITADCGTSSIHDIAHAVSLGMDVIVTDHHQVHFDLPPALATLNPQRPDSLYPCRDLAGVGVAFRLAQALLPQADLGSMLDLAALGTVVDVAPLLGENRVFARQGLALMRRAPRPGLKALMDIARIAPATVSAGMLSFALGPRLNAAGRLDTAKVSYDLLRSPTVLEAQPLAQKLDEQNRERQRLLEAALFTARAEAAQQVLQSPLIFIASEEYKPGIVGLVAGRLAEEFGRPAIAIERGAELSRGSCRSIAGFNIGEALECCHDLFERHGGHAQAAGFTIRSERLPELQQQLTAIAARELDGYSFDKIIKVDALIVLNQADWQTLGWVKRMEPFGVGNPAPVFRSNGVRLRQVRRVGNDHLKLSVTDGKLTWPAIAFRQGARAPEFAEGDRVDMVYNLEDQEWNGEHTLQLIVKDLRPSTRV